MTKLTFDSEFHDKSCRAFAWDLARALKTSIEHSQIGSESEREALFTAILPVLFARISGRPGEVFVIDDYVVPVLSFLKCNFDEQIATAKPITLEAHIPELMNALSGPATELSLDGSNFSTLEGFYDEVSIKLIPGATWGRNLDAFNDILRGGFGTPESGFVLRWRNSDTSKVRLGYAETVRQLEARYQRCHPSNQASVAEKLELARREQGPTVFDWLVEIILDHGRAGEQASDNIRLVLE